MVIRKWLREWVKGMVSALCTSNGQNPKQGLWQAATGLASKAGCCCSICSACFSPWNLNGAVLNLVFVSFSATEQDRRGICVQPWMGREVQVEQFHLYLSSL